MWEVGHTAGTCRDIELPITANLILYPCCQNFVQGIKYVKNRDIIICAQCTSHLFIPEQLRMMDHICEDFLTDRMGLQCTKSSESMIYTAVKKRYSVLLPNINQRPTLMHQAHFNFNMFNMQRGRSLPLLENAKKIAAAWC